MKANELMIGDWVEYRFTGWTEKGGVYKDYQYVQISTILPKGLIAHFEHKGFFVLLERVDDINYFTLRILVVII